MKKNAPTQTFTITGLAGNKSLSGTIKIQGAKNAALKAMAAAILFDGPVTLRNIPHTSDIDTLTEIMRKLGAKVTWLGNGAQTDHTMIIDATTIDHTDMDPVLSAGMRASVVLTGPLLARFGKVTFPAPGGCVIGARPIDLFIDGYEKMGAKVTLKDGLYNIENPRSGQALRSTNIKFRTISVGGTETLMMTAVLTEGTTVLENCAKEPEIVNVAEWLISCGAKIEGVGTDKITIRGLGNGKLLKPRNEYITIPDRIEAGSYMILGVLCARDLRIVDCEPRHLEIPIEMLKGSGVLITTRPGEIIISNNIKPNSSFRGFDIITAVYPGFATDLQSPMVTFLTQTSGQSRVKETIFEGRFKFVTDLQNLGAKIVQVNDKEILITGPTELTDSKTRDLQAHDIRAGFAVLLGALCARGTFTINQPHLIDRGYEKIIEKLSGIGVSIK